MAAITVPLGVVQVKNNPVLTVANGLPPYQGESLAVSVPLPFDVSVQGLLIDMTESAWKFADVPVQGAFLDLSACPIALQVIVPMSAHTVLARAYTQGYYPLFVPMPVKLEAVLVTIPTGPITIGMTLYNSVIAPRVWNTR